MFVSKVVIVYTVVLFLSHHDSVTKKYSFAIR